MNYNGKRVTSVAKMFFSVQGFQMTCNGSDFLRAIVDVHGRYSTRNVSKSFCFVQINCTGRTYLSLIGACLIV